MRTFYATRRLGMRPETGARSQTVIEMRTQILGAGFVELPVEDAAVTMSTSAKICFATAGVHDDRIRLC